MPLKQCESGGESGWKWGDSGKCYTGPGAKQKAIRQALAIGGGEMPTEKATVHRLHEARLARVRKRVRL